MDENTRRLQALVDLIRARNPYQLSRDGELSLPGFAPIALLGLSDEQATLRLTYEPGLHGVNIRLTRLPLRRTGVAGLKPFGYDIFNKGAPSTFAPVANVPVPADYVVGPTDILNVQLYGDQNRSLRLTVDRDGSINIPELGPMQVAGERFSRVKESIEARFEHRKLGVHASVSMGDTRSLHVFVLGEVRRPGSYTLQWTRDDHFRVVRSRRDQAHRFTARCAVEAPGRTGAAFGPVQHADSRRHGRRCQASRGGRGLRASYRSDRKR